MITQKIKDLAVSMGHVLNDEPPYPNWVLNEANALWVAPVPSLGVGYFWNQDANKWQPVTQV